MMQPINAQNANSLRAQVEESQKYRRQYDFTRRFICRAGQKGAETIPMPSEGDFQLEGYNLEYQLQADNQETIFIRFRQQDGGKSWSNDYIPIRSIATPGRRNATYPGIRYGFRQFAAYVRANDMISIEWDNVAGSEDLEVFVTFTGFMWYNFK
jgi:hypothetical protein